jgi:hypothetical protein
MLTENSGKLMSHMRHRVAPVWADHPLLNGEGDCLKAMILIECGLNETGTPCPGTAHGSK